MNYFKSDILNQDIQWDWADDCQEKQYWNTWIPKKSNLKIITKLKREEMQMAKNELWDNLQDAIHLKRRQKRLANKS